MKNRSHRCDMDTLSIKRYLYIYVIYKIKNLF